MNDYIHKVDKKCENNVPDVISLYLWTQYQNHFGLWSDKNF